MSHPTHSSLVKNSHPRSPNQELTGSNINGNHCSLFLDFTSRRLTNKIRASDSGSCQEDWKHHFHFECHQHYLNNIKPKYPTAMNMGGNIIRYLKKVITMDLLERKARSTPTDSRYSISSLASCHTRSSLLDVPPPGRPGNKPSISYSTPVAANSRAREYKLFVDRFWR